MINVADLPLRKTMCATCPFRPRSPYAYLAGQLAASALEDASRICHSTGSNAILGRTGLPQYFCRGARDIQLKVFAAMGTIAAATDEAWNAKRLELGMAPTTVADPNKIRRKRC